MVNPEISQPSSCLLAPAPVLIEICGRKKCSQTFRTSSACVLKNLLLFLNRPDADQPPPDRGHFCLPINCHPSGDVASCLSEWPTSAFLGHSIHHSWAGSKLFSNEKWKMKNYIIVKNDIFGGILIKWLWLLARYFSLSLAYCHSEIRLAATFLSKLPNRKPQMPSTALHTVIRIGCLVLSTYLE